jgi:hypothetical protein
MNHRTMNLQHRAPDSPLDFDLLADGELGEERRRALLSRLDDHPEGWRRCALAFLEAQDWKREMPRAGGVDDDAPAADASTAIAENAASRVVVARRPPLGWLGTMLAMAASFLLALGMGIVWRGGWHGDEVADHPAHRPGAELVLTHDPAAEPADSVPVVPEPGVPQFGPDAPRYGKVMLAVLGADGQERLVEVPILTADRYDPQLLSGQPAALSHDLVRQLQRAGHEVNQYRELVPVSLEDGRQLVLPVDQVEVRFVNQGYQ